MPIIILRPARPRNLGTAPEPRAATTPPNVVDYSAAKAAVVNLATGLARHL